MKQPQLLYIDSNNQRHYVALEQRSADPGFWVVRTEQDALLTVHARALLMVPYQEDLEQILDGNSVPIRHVPVTAQEPGWTEWRNDAPAYGRKIEVRSSQFTRLDMVHSAAQAQSLMEQGYRHWRYAI